MLGAEKLAAPTPESGQTDLSPAAGAPVHHALRRRRLILLRSGSVGRRLPDVVDERDGSLRCARRNRDLLGGEFQVGGGGCGCGGGCVEAFLTHVVCGWISDDSAIVDAELYLLWNLELRLFLLRPLSHCFDSDSDSDSEFTENKLYFFILRWKENRNRNRGEKERADEREK